MLTPILLFSALFAVSMDYEVLILSRVREVYDRTGDNVAAVEAGLGNSGRTVLGAAFVMLSVFGAYAFSHLQPLRELGLGLSFAILLDATIVRLLVVPAALLVMGRWNYWPFDKGRPPVS